MAELAYIERDGGAIKGVYAVSQGEHTAETKPWDDAEVLAYLTPKSYWLSRVDDDAERVRLRYLTPGAGMAMTYAEKRDQANAVHAMGEDAANALTEAERIAQFPTLAASVGLEAPTLWGCALLVISKSEAWADLSNVIERTRLLGKKAISDASDAATARAAYEAITWQT
jgi:hypothetical protein